MSPANCRRQRVGVYDDDVKRLTTRRAAIALWGCLGLALLVVVGLWATRLTMAFAPTTSAISPSGVVQEPPNDAYLAPRPTPTVLLTPGGKCQRIMGVTGVYVYLSVKTGSLLTPAQAKNC
jgi:hypothetical protein